MYLFGCCARKNDDAEREGSLLSPKVGADNQPRRSKRSKKPHYGLVSQCGQTLPLDPSARSLEVHVAPGEYEGGNYCLALILPENTEDVSVTDSGQGKTGGRVEYGDFSVSSSVQLLDEDSDGGIVEADNVVVAAEEEVCFSKSSDGSRWSTLCEASNGSSARELGDGSGISSGYVGRRIVCESPDTGISWSFPDIASSDEQGNSFDSPRVRLSGTATREGRTAGDNPGISDGKKVLPSHSAPVGDVSEYTADSCAPVNTETVPEFMSQTGFVQDNVFAGNGEKFSNDVVRVTQYVLETINRVCDSFENQDVVYIDDEEPVDQAQTNGNGSGYGQESPAELTKTVDNIVDSEVFNVTLSKSPAEDPSDESDDFIYTEDPVDNNKQSSYIMNSETDETKDFEYVVERDAETSMEFTSSTQLHAENYNSFDCTIENNGEDNRIVDCDDFEQIELVCTEENDIHFNKSLEHNNEQQHAENYNSFVCTIEINDEDNRIAVCDDFERIELAYTEESEIHSKSLEYNQEQQRDDYCNSDSKYEMEDNDGDYEQLLYTSYEEIVSEAHLDHIINDDNRTVNIGSLADDIANFYTANFQEDDYLELIADRFVREVLKSSLEEQDLGQVEPLMNVGVDKSSENDMTLCGEEDWEVVSEGSSYEQSLLSVNEQEHRVLIEKIRQEISTDDLNISEMELQINTKEWHSFEENRSPTKENRSPTEQNRFPTKENRSPTEQNRFPTEENRYPTEQNRFPTKENRSPNEENRSPTEKNRSPTEQNRSPTEVNRSPTEENRSPTKENRFPTKVNLSPTEENRSPSEVNRSPTEDNRSPTEQNRSPTEVNRSLTEEDHSLTKENRSITEVNRYPTEENRSPTEENRSPTEQNRSPTKETRSPTEENRSPTKETRSPTEETRFPTEETRYPTEENRSPTKENRSPTKETRSPTEELVSVNDEWVSEMQLLSNGSNFQLEQPVVTSDRIVLENKQLFTGAEADEEQLHTVSKEISNEELDVTCDGTCPEEQVVSSEEIPTEEDLAMVNLVAANYVNSFIIASITEAMVKEASNLCKDIMETPEELNLFDFTVDKDVLSDQYHEYETLLEFNENLLLLPPAGYCEEAEADDSCQSHEFHEHMENSLESLDLHVGLQDISPSSKLDEVKSDLYFPSRSAGMIEISTQRMGEEQLIPPVEVDKRTPQVSDCKEQPDIPNQLLEISPETECSESETLPPTELFWKDIEASMSDLTNQIDKEIEAVEEPSKPVELSDSNAPFDVSADDGYCSFSGVENAITIHSGGQFGFSVDDSNNSVMCQSKPDVAVDDVCDEITNLNGNNNLDTRFTESETHQMTDKSSEESLKSEPFDNNMSNAEVIEEDLVNANMLNLSNVSNDIEELAETSVENKTVVQIAAGCESSESRLDDANTADDVAVESDKPVIKNSSDIERVVSPNDDEKRRNSTPAVIATPERRHGKTRFTRTKVLEEDIFVLPSHSYRFKSRSEGPQHTLPSTGAASPSSNINAEFFSAYIIDLSKDLIEDDQKSRIDEPADQISSKDSIIAATATSKSARKPGSRSDHNSASIRLVDDMLLLSPDSCRDLANFVERPPIVRRSISLKTSPTGTPRKKKAVRFADALGLDLESIRHIRSNEDIPTVPTSALPHDASPLVVQNPAASSVTRRYLYMEFSQPRSQPDFLCRVYDQKVSLESCLCDDRDLLITGSIRVYNLSFRKEVIVRYTTNGWVTYRDTPASYLTNSSDGTTDQFSFTIVLPRYFDVGSRLEFAIWYRAGEDLEQSHWDNNHDANYSVDCYSNCGGGNSESPAWLHFL